MIASPHRYHQHLGSDDLTQFEVGFPKPPPTLLVAIPLQTSPVHRVSVVHPVLTSGVNHCFSGELRETPPERGLYFESITKGFARSSTLIWIICPPRIISCRVFFPHVQKHLGWPEK